VKLKNGVSASSFTARFSWIAVGQSASPYEYIPESDDEEEGGE
jgi:hypothetical protein